MMTAVLSSSQHPEYGHVTVSFPIPPEQYDQTIEMLQAMDLGFSRNRDCSVYSCRRRNSCGKTQRNSTNGNEEEYHNGFVFEMPGIRHWAGPAHNT